MSWRRSVVVSVPQYRSARLSHTGTHCCSLAAIKLYALYAEMDESMRMTCTSPQASGHISQAPSPESAPATHACRAAACMHMADPHPACSAARRVRPHLAALRQHVVGRVVPEELEDVVSVVDLIVAPAVVVQGGGGHPPPGWCGVVPAGESAGENRGSRGPRCRAPTAPEPAALPGSADAAPTLSSLPRL